MDNEICFAAPSDIFDLIRLLNVLFSQETEFEPDQRRQKNGLSIILDNRDIGEILVIKKRNTIVGMISLLYSISTALGGRVAILEDMIIDPLYRDMGLGKKLLRAAINHSRIRGCLRITLLTDHDNDTAISFYEKFGFERSEMIPMRCLF